MTTTIRANLADVTPQFWQDLKSQMGETALNAPTQMPIDLDFEHLLDLAAEAYHQKTGKQFTSDF